VNRVIDFDEPREKAAYIHHVRTLTGRVRVEETRYRPRRSDRQNRYYWPCFVEPFSDWLAVEWGAPVTPEHAHAILKTRYLTARVTNPDTGESLEYVRSTTELDTAEFNQYLDNVASFLAETCGFEVPEPSIYHERDAAAA
jgi:hypothetical protein